MSENRGVVSIGKQFQIQMRSYATLLFSDKKGIIVSLLFPVMADIVIVWITGKNMFVDYEGTQPSVFVIVSAAIWAGLFNTAQTIVSIRKNIKRDYDAGLSLGPYVASRAILQFILCALQAAIMTAAFPIATAIYGNDFIEGGIFFDGSPVGAIIEIFISMVLLTYAADLMGLLLSTIIKKAETGSTLTPYILIAQLIFSGSLFEMTGAGKVVSWLMISRWGNESIGAICDLENAPSKFMIDPDPANLMLPAEEQVHLPRENAADLYAHDLQHLLITWGVLILFCVVFIVATRIAINTVKKDDRSTGI